MTYEGWIYNEWKSQRDPSIAGSTQVHVDRQVMWL